MLPTLVMVACDYLECTDWLVQACTEASVLFLDEVDRATLRFVRSFRVDRQSQDQWLKLHPDTIIVAAVNGGEHGAQYQVEMDPAELDRWTVFDVEPSVEDWLMGERQRCHSCVGLHQPQPLSP